jgi:DNA-binding transcriptional regulator YiaG
MSSRPVPSQLDQVLPRFSVQKLGPYHPFGRIRIAPFGKGVLRFPGESGLLLEFSSANRGHEAQRHSAATRDPDAVPLTPADSKRMKRTPQVKLIRRALGLTQEEFDGRFHIPLGTLRDWEQGAAVPDPSACAYLTAARQSKQLPRRRQALIIASLGCLVSSRLSRYNLTVIARDQSA